MRERIAESNTVVKGTPSNPAIKFCGIRRSEDAAIANFLQPDYVGFVFWAKSKRAVTVGEAKALRAMMGPRITTVGVFIDAEVEVIAMLFAEGVISVAQLQGHEDADYLSRLREAAPGIVIWKMQQIKSAADIDAANASPADFVLLENGLNEDTAFDWTLLDAMKRPFALSGYLDPENVEEAITIARPSLVDVSDGIEADEQDTLVKACKDEAKMRAFYRNVKRATRALTETEEPSPAALTQDLSQHSNTYESPYAANPVEDPDYTLETTGTTTEASTNKIPLERFEGDSGSYVAGSLTQAIIELEQAYEQHRDNPDFEKELDQLLCTFAKHPSLLRYVLRKTPILSRDQIAVLTLSNNHSRKEEW